MKGPFDDDAMPVQGQDQTQDDQQNVATGSMGENLQTYADLEVEKARLEAATKAVNIRMANLEAVIINQMADAGLSKATIAGGKTYAVRRILSASPAEGADRAQVGAALKEAGYGDLVQENYNALSLNALVREFDRDATGGEGGASPEELAAFMPEALRGVLKLHERYGLSSRKA